MDDFEIDVSGNAKRWVRGPLRVDDSPPGN
jgi:hypothetical protein